MQWEEPTERGIWVTQWLMVQNYVALNTTFKKMPEKQATFRSASGKDKQLDYLLIDKRNSKLNCADAEANDMICLESDHRSVTVHFRFPCVKKKGGLNNGDQEHNIFSKMQDASDIQHPRKKREAPEPTERSMKSSEYMMNSEKRFTGKHEAAANEKADITERQHATTTTATQRGEMVGDAEQQQLTAMTAAHREETIDSKDQELSALIEKRKNMERKEKAQVKDISKEIKKGNQRQQKIQNT